MTVEELSQLYYINKTIMSLQLELANLRQSNFYKPNIMSDMPRGGQGEERNVKYVDAVMELEDMINYNLRSLQGQRQRIDEFIESIEDPELRLIMRLRAVNNMSWYQIGDEVGIDRRTASKKFYDYFKNN